MPHQDSRAEYAERMHRVLAHIDEHIDQPLDLARLAQVAHFSAFHFHRLFAAWRGETLGDDLRRRRLEVAAMRMIAQPRPCFEYCAPGARYEPETGRFGCDIVIPVIPL